MSKNNSNLVKKGSKTDVELKKTDVFAKNTQYKEESLKVRKARESRLRSQQLVTLPSGLSFDRDSKSFLKTLYEAGVASKHKLHELQFCLDLHNAYYKKESASSDNSGEIVTTYIPPNDRD